MLCVVHSIVLHRVPPITVIGWRESCMLMIVLLNCLMLRVVHLIVFHWVLPITGRLSLRSADVLIYHTSSPEAALITSSTAHWLQASCSCVRGVTRSAATVRGWRLSALDRHRPPIIAIGWCLDVWHRKNTNVSQRQEFSRHWTVSLDWTICLSHYLTEISHLYSLRDFWRHFGLCRAAVHSDCCFFAWCTNILTYLLTYLLTPCRAPELQE